MKKYISILSFLAFSFLAGAQTHGAKQQYGDLAKKASIKIVLKPEVKMYSLDEILEEFHVNPKHKNLRVCIDKEIIDHPEELMANIAEIDDVVIASGRYLGFTDASRKQEAFIYITRKKLKEISL